MPNAEDILVELAEKREGYKTFVDSVDEDLKRERLRRIAVRQSEIRDLVIRAHLAGARTADIKRAYNTTDHRTITNILASAEEEIALRAQETEPVEAKALFQFIDDGVTIWEAGDMATFNIETLEDGSVMLISRDDLYPNGYDHDQNKSVALWDGAILTAENSGGDATGAVYRAIKNRGDK
jgi:hypothetical protein